MTDSAFALVTGSSGGIGEAFARGLSARRHDLVLVARSEEKLRTLAAELKSRHGIRVEVVPADLSVSGAATALVQTLTERGIEVDLLVNNAGFGARGSFGSVPLDRYQQMLRLNAEALLDLTYLLVPPMLQKGRGAVINVSSTAAFQPVPWTSVYAATKAFVTSFSLGLAEELHGSGVAVVTLCPGGTQTHFFEAGQYGLRSMPGGLQPAEQVAAEALRQLDRGGGLVVPRLLNKATIFVQRFLPRSLVLKVTADLFRPAEHRR